MCSRGVIGPYFFEDGGGDTQTVKAQRYQAVLVKFWRVLKTRLNNDQKTIKCEWFQQGGSPAHTAQETRDCLREQLRRAHDVQV